MRIYETPQDYSRAPPWALRLQRGHVALASGLPMALVRGAVGGMAYEMATWPLKGARRLGAITQALLDRAASDPDALAQVLQDAAVRANDRGDQNGPAWAAFAADPQLQDALASMRAAAARGRTISSGAQSFVRRRIDEMRQYVVEQAVVIQQQEQAAQAVPAEDRAAVIRAFEERISALAQNAREFRARVPGTTSFVGALFAWDPESLQTEYRDIHDDILAETMLTQAEKDRLIARLRGEADRELQQTAVAVTTSGQEASLQLDWLERLREQFLSLGALKYAVAGAVVLGGGWAAWKVYRAVRPARNPCPRRSAHARRRRRR